jgi:predicted enzyme related to lactoylglutathione lyase
LVESIEEAAMSNRVVHFEIPADDPERAKAFYADAFGWNIASWEGSTYMMVGTVATNEQGMPQEPGAINGGMLPRQDPINTPVITIDVADMDSAIKTVEELGGKVIRGKQSVGNAGFAAYFVDTEGNTLGLWQAAASA